MNLGIHFAVSSVPQTCARCADIGLPPDGIAPGERYLEFKASGELVPCCADCWARLLEQCEEYAEEEGP